MAVNDVAAAVCSSCRAPLPGTVLRSAAGASMGAGLAPLSSGFPDEVAPDSGPLPLRYAGPADAPSASGAAAGIEAAVAEPAAGIGRALTAAPWRPPAPQGPFQVGFAADGHALIQVTHPPDAPASADAGLSVPDAGLFDGSAAVRRRRAVQPGTAFIGGAVVASLVLLGGFAWVRSASRAPAPVVPSDAVLSGAPAPAQTPAQTPAPALARTPAPSLAPSPAPTGRDVVAAPAAFSLPGAAPAEPAAARTPARAGGPPAAAAIKAAAVAATPPGAATAPVSTARPIAPSPPAGIGPCTAAVAALGLCTPEPASPSTNVRRE